MGFRYLGTIYGQILTSNFQLGSYKVFNDKDIWTHAGSAFQEAMCAKDRGASEVKTNVIHLQ